MLLAYIFPNEQIMYIKIILIQIYLYFSDILLPKNHIS